MGSVDGEVTEDRFEPAPEGGEARSCIDTSAYPPEEREMAKQLLAAAAAAREILSQANSSSVEYGVVLYRDQSGNIRSGVLYNVGSPTMTGYNYGGLSQADIANIVGLLHSHTDITFFEGAGEDRLRPTNPADWEAHDWYVAITAHALQQQGLSPAAAQAQAASQINMYILGQRELAGGSGSFERALRVYRSDQRQSGFFGVDIDLTKEACP